jgi:SAM-dependent methyltransferase
MACFSFPRLAALALAGSVASAAWAQTYPAPGRPVADVVSPSWGDAAKRDQAQEVQAIIVRLRLTRGMALADIGAGSGYDTLPLARFVGGAGRVYAEDITPAYLDALAARVRAEGLANIVLVKGAPDDPRLPAHALDAAIMIHMYHEIAQPYALLHRLALAMKPGGLVGVEELDRPTQAHGTPPKLLVCEFQAVGYRLVAQAPMPGGLGYFTVFSPPAPSALPSPDSIRPCTA